MSSTSVSTSSTSASSTSSSSSTSTTAIPLNLDYTYQDTLALPSIVADDIDLDLDSDKNYQNEAVDDGDYFIQYGSEYMVQEYKKTWTNNTDIPSFTFQGRSTYDTRISPLLIQIFNVNSAIWETLATINTLPADTDFQQSVTQATNISNYYDSANRVTFRIYQQVL